LALFIRRVSSCPSGDEVANLLKAILGQEDAEASERVQYFLGDAASLWGSCVKSRRDANESKARFVWLAQISLMNTSVSVGTIIVGLTINK
jgi:hypothetical protein